MAHQFNPDMLPDSAYAPGSYRYLVPGNRGRTLDSRRTPFRVLEVLPATGQFVVEIEGFEDKGARWTEECEVIRHCQFEHGSALAPEDLVAEIEAAVKRLDVPLVLPADTEAAGDTARALESRRVKARDWLDRNSGFFARHAAIDTASPEHRKLLAADLQEYLGQLELWDMETEFAEVFVSNPYSGETVKGHRIVLAEMGLARFSDKAVRDPRIFDGDWSKEKRREHILSRLGFLGAVFDKAGLKTLLLYRGISFQDRPELRNKTFVSTSLDFEVARSCFGRDGITEAGILYRQPVSVDRVFMSCLETDPMNRQFQESEVVLMLDPENPLF